MRSVLSGREDLNPPFPPARLCSLAGSPPLSLRSPKPVTRRPRPTAARYLAMGGFFGFGGGVGTYPLTAGGVTAGFLDGAGFGLSGIWRLLRRVTAFVGRSGPDLPGLRSALGRRRRGWNVALLDGRFRCALLGKVRLLLLRHGSSLVVSSRTAANGQRASSHGV